ncbi:MAG: hypothetical protein QOJ00_2195 [Actinomycetota bacterium]
MRDFDELVGEAEAAPIVGWDFSWLDGRATEARPSWQFRERVARRAATANAMLELSCGDGTLLAALPHTPPLVVATEGYWPNATIAAQRIENLIATLDNELPLRDEAFDLVTSRHPIVAWWNEVARVLEPDGAYVAQHVGPGSGREITSWLMGPHTISMARHPDHARRAAMAVGLDVVDLRAENLPMIFDDIGAVVYFLRLVVWMVPDFSVPRYRDRLRAMHEHIEKRGPFHATSARFFIDARKLA